MPAPALGRPPLRLVLTGGVAAAFLVLPVAALVGSAPWRRMGAIVGEQEVRQALLLSLWTSTLAAIFCFLLGLPLAWLLAR